MSSPIASGSPPIPQYSPEVLTNLKTAVKGLEAAYATADPAKILEATAAMSQALESAKQAGAVMQEPEPTTSADAAKAAQTIASFPMAELQADIFSMMKLFQGMEREERNSARMSREVSLQTKVGQLESQATEMEKAGEKRFESAMINGAMQIVGGAMSVGMAGAGAYKQVQGIRTEAAGNASIARGDMAEGGLNNSWGATMQTMGKTQTASGMAMGQSAGGIGQMASGLGGVAAAFSDKEAAAADVAAKRAETNATVADTAIQAANDRMQRAKEIIDDMMSKISDMERSNIETNKGIARNV